MEIVHYIVAAVGAIAAWALKSTIEHGQKIAMNESKMQSTKEESERRFGEIEKSLESIHKMLLEMIMKRRSGDQ